MTCKCSALQLSDVNVVKSVELVTCETANQSNIQCGSLPDLCTEVVSPNTDKKVFGRCFYNSNVNKRDVQGLLVRGSCKAKVKRFMGSENAVKASLHEHNKLRPDIGDTSRVPATGRVHETGVLTGHSEPVVILNYDTIKQRVLHDNVKVKEVAEQIGVKHTKTGGNNECTELNLNNRVDSVHSAPVVTEICGVTAHMSDMRNQETRCHGGDSNINVVNSNDTQNNDIDKYSLLFDINGTAELYAQDGVRDKMDWRKHVELLKATCSDFSSWRAQTDFNFGFVPLSNLVVKNCSNHIDTSIDDQHVMGKKAQPSKLLGARIQVNSQLNIEEWEWELTEYWDQHTSNCCILDFFWISIEIACCVLINKIIHQQLNIQKMLWHI